MIFRQREKEEELLAGTPTTAQVLRKCSAVESHPSLYLFFTFFVLMVSLLLQTFSQTNLILQISSLKRAFQKLTVNFKVRKLLESLWRKSFKIVR